jgi:hypothetical protein
MQALFRKTAEGSGAGTVGKTTAKIHIGFMTGIRVLFENYFCAANAVESPDIFILFLRDLFLSLNIFYSGEKRDATRPRHKTAY